MPDRLQTIEVSSAQTAKLINYLSKQPGFVEFSLQRERRCFSCWPEQRWPLADDKAVFSRTLCDINKAHADMASSVLSAGQAPTPVTDFQHSPGSPGVIAGVLFYEAGKFSVPGFETADTQPQPTLGYAGQYLWHLETDGSGEHGVLLFHPACPDVLHQRLCTLAKEPLSVSTALPSEPSFRLAQPFTAEKTEANYQRGVRRILELISAGDCYQVNLSQKFTASYEGAPYQAFQSLRCAVPVPHSAYVDAGHYQVLSISPEMFLQVVNGEVTSKPIKGTRPRHQNPARDAELARDLASSVKDRAENLMIVDLIRNDLSHFCDPFSVKVPTLFEIESYQNVHQLVSTVTGQLSPQHSALDALVCAFPGGSITGAPKRRAMEIIDELETHRRGPYCGSVFWWDSKGTMESNIAIRTLMTDADGDIHCWGGCGIVADSDPKAEFDESMTKVRKLMDVLAQL